MYPTILLSYSPPPSLLAPSHLTGWCRGFPTFSSTSPPSPYSLTSSLPCSPSRVLQNVLRPPPSPPPFACLLISLFSAGCCWTFVTCALFCSSPRTLFGLLVAPSRQFLSGQLTGCCRTFPATRATGKRPSTALFDVPSPLILYTWTTHCTAFLLNRSSLVLPLLSFFPSFLQRPSLDFSISPCSLLLHNMVSFSICFKGGRNSIPQRHRGLVFLSSLSSFLIKTRPTPVSSSTQTLLKLCFACFGFLTPLLLLLVLVCPFFLSISFSLFLFPNKCSQSLQLFCCRHGGQKFWHCVVWMPYFQHCLFRVVVCQEPGPQGPLPPHCSGVTVPKHWLAKEERGEKTEEDVRRGTNSRTLSRR